MTEDVVIRCTRCTELPVASVASTKDRCTQCGEHVWVSHATLSMVITRYPGAAVKPVCMACVSPEPGLVAILPEQVNVLRRLGEPDDVIAYKLAIAELAGGTLSLEAAEREIRTFPNGMRAKAFPGALARATHLVRTTPRG